MFKEIKVGSIDFASGQIKTFDNFVTTDLYQDLDLRVNLVVNSSGGTTSGTVVPGGAYKIIKNLYLALAGKTIKQVDGEALFIKNWIDDKKQPAYQDMDNDNIGNHVVTTSLEWNFESEYLKDEHVDMQVENDDDVVSISMKDITTLNPNGRTMQLKVEWGTIADLVTGGDRTHSITGTLDIVARVRDDIDRRILHLISRDTDIQASNVSPSGDYRKKLPEGGVLQRILMKFNDDTSVSRVRVYADQSVLLYDIDTAHLKLKNQHDTSVTLPNGWFLLDFNPAGDLVGGIDYAKWTKIELSFVVVSTTDIEIYLDDIIELSGE